MAFCVFYAAEKILIQRPRRVNKQIAENHELKTKM